MQSRKVAEFRCERRFSAPLRRAFRGTRDYRESLAREPVAAACHNLSQLAGTAPL